jgi:hypothetical protein
VGFIAQCSKGLKNDEVPGRSVSVMIKKMLAIGVLLAAPALAQSQPASAPTPPPGPTPVPADGYIPLQDHPTCTRDELKAQTDAYVKAQSIGDLSGMQVSSMARFVQNTKTIDRKDGIWAKPLPIAHAMSLHDDKRCKTFTEIIVTKGGHPYVIGTRLYMNNGNIIRVDSMVTQKGDWLFNANAYLKFAKLDEWVPAHRFQKTSASEMMRGANAYLDAFSDKFTDIPWGVPCARLEGGFYTNHAGNPNPTCSVGLPSGVNYIIDRDYLIDEEMGVINVFCRFEGMGGMPDVHSFRFIDGKIRGIHTLTINMSNTPAWQASDDGVILKN